MIITTQQFHKYLKDTPWLCIDFETTGLDYLRDDILGIAILTDKGGGYLPLYNNPLAIEETKEILNNLDSNTVFINWNIKFDLHFLNKLTDVHRFNNIVDVQVGYWLLNEEASMALKPTLETIFNKKLPDFSDLLDEATAKLHTQIEEQREAYVQSAPKGQKGIYRQRAATLFPLRPASPWEIDINKLAEYAYRDVFGTMFLWVSYIHPLLRDEGILGYFYSYEMPILKILWEMEERGIRIDHQRLHIAAKEFEEEILGLKKKIYSFAGQEFNINSTRRLRDILFNSQGNNTNFIPPSKQTPSGEISLDKGSLKELSWKYKKETDVFNNLLDYRKLLKEKNDYCVRLPELAVNERIHTSFNNTATATGRFSSSSPNLQNVPKKGSVRKSFIASEGHTIIKADLAQAELRVLADRTNDKKLVSAYNEARDIHTETMNNLKLEDRKLAKVINFLVVYGGGASNYQQNLFFDNKIFRELEQCEEDIRNFYSSYSGIKPWKQKVIKYAQDHGYVVTRFGRRRHLNTICSDKWVERSYAERQAVNVLIQGDVADYVKAVMIKVQSKLKEIGGTLLLQVHDELVAEVPENRVEEGVQIFKENMQNLITMKVPILCDVGIGKNWGETKET